MADEPDEAHEATGLAHVATVSFLASRLAPSAQFWLALAGGVAIARAGARRGLSAAAGVSLAGMLQTIALLGPLRLNGPLTQAMSAPVLGAMHRRGRGPVALVLACVLIRAAHYLVVTTALIWLVLGGFDAYVKSFDNLFGWTGIVPTSTTAVLLLTIANNAVWALALSIIQVLAYRRALERWPADPGTAPTPAPAPAAAGEEDTGSDFDPRALALAAIVAFALLLASPSWPVLAAVAAWLALAWLAATPGRDIARVGLALAALFAIGTLLGGLIGSLGTDEALRRGLRGGMLVLVATWLRGAAGPAGMRELFRRTLHRLRRFGWAREAGRALEGLDSGGRLAAAGRALVDRLQSVPRQPLPVVDATLAWVASEAGAFRGPASAPPPALLRPRARDGLLVALAVLPVLALVGG